MTVTLACFVCNLAVMMRWLTGFHPMRAEAAPYSMGVLVAVSRVKNGDAVTAELLSLSCPAHLADA